MPCGEQVEVPHDEDGGIEGLRLKGYACRSDFKRMRVCTPSGSVDRPLQERVV